MSDNYAEIDCIFHGMSPSGLAIFISLDEDDEETIAIPVSCVHEDDRGALEDYLFFDAITINVKEEIAQEKGII